MKQMKNPTVCLQPKKSLPFITKFFPLLLTQLLMTKFFLQPGARISRQKKPQDYRFKAFKSLLKIVKVFCTHETQRIIKKLKKTKQNNENTDCNQRQKQLVTKLEGLKAISTPIIKQIVYFIMRNHLKISNLDGLQQTANIIPNEQIMKKCQQQDSLETTIIKKIAQSETGKAQFQKVASLCDRIGKKKATKKEKSKVRKQRKLQYKKMKVQLGQQENQNQKLPSRNFNIIEHIQQQKLSTKPLPIATNNIKHRFEKTQRKWQKRTDFKKTGRNKIIHQKRAQKMNRFNEQQNMKTKPIQKQHKNQLHPSWQAKKQQQEQAYFNINQFKGKKILL